METETQRHYCAALDLPAEVVLTYQDNKNLPLNDLEVKGNKNTYCPSAASFTAVKPTL